MNAHTLDSKIQSALKVAAMAVAFGDRAAVPLPASLPLLGAAVAGLAALRRRKK